MNHSIKNLPLYLLFYTLLLAVASCKPDDNKVINPTPIVIGCNDVDVDAVWEDRGTGIDYILDCAITVNAKLTVKPGVTIQCKSNSGIEVGTSGILVAAGTSAAPIIFSGDVDVAGIWKGLYVRSSSVLNEITYCTIANGGGESFDGNGTKLANIRVALNARLKLTNSTISKSFKDGLLVDGLDTDNENPVSTFSSNTFTGNQNYPISSIASIGNVLDAASVYTGNTKNKILFRGGALHGTHVWQKLSVPYLVESIVSVGYSSTTGNLTISPGVTVQFAGDAGLCTGDYSTGSWMRIVGSSPPNIITLTGETAAPGSWKGIAFQSTSPNNAISYAVVEYGGSSSYTGNGAQRGNIMAGAWSAGSFSINNTNVLNSAAYGIYVTATSPTITVPGSVYYNGNASGNYHEE